MKKIASILIFILFLIAAKIIGNFGGKYAATSKQPNQHELLRMFVSEFFVNNKDFKYPIKINEELYLDSRSIKDEDQSMFVVENYRIISPITASSGEIAMTEENTRQQVKTIFCASLQERDRLFSGYSSVGMIQNLTSPDGKKLFSIKVEKSQCL